MLNGMHFPIDVDSTMLSKSRCHAGIMIILQDLCPTRGIVDTEVPLWIVTS